MNDTKKYMKEWRENHQDHLKAYYHKRKEHYKKLKRKHYLKNKRKFAERIKKWRLENPEKVKEYADNGKATRANYHLQKTFGITLEHYSKLLEKQDLKCAICGRHKDEFKRSLHVDHNHDDPKSIRGLLCVNCNKMLGHAFDNPSILERGALYLKKQRS